MPKKSKQVNKPKALTGKKRRNEVEKAASDYDSDSDQALSEISHFSR